jgi:hypothetical protein
MAARHGDATLDVMREPPGPDTDPAPLASTIVALALTITAWLFTLPAAVLEIYTAANPDWEGSWALASDAWSVAFLVGVLSLVLALLVRRWERKRGSTRGQRLAGVAVLAAILGAFMWTGTFMIVGQAI